MRTVELRRTGQRCLHVIDELQLETPITMSSVASAVAAWQHKPVVLNPFAMPLNISGLAICTAHVDYVIYNAASTRLQQFHAVAHELGHLVFHHGAKSAPDAVGQPQRETGDWSVERVAVMLGTAGRSEDEETEAEMFAALVLARASAARQAVRPVVWPNPAGAPSMLGALVGADERGRGVPSEFGLA